MGPTGVSTTSFYVGDLSGLFYGVFMSRSPRIMEGRGRFLSVSRFIGLTSLVPVSNVRCVLCPVRSHEGRGPSTLRRVESTVKGRLYHVEENFNIERRKKRMEGVS